MLQERGSRASVCMTARETNGAKIENQVQLIVWIEKTRNFLQEMGVWKATWFLLLHPELKNLDCSHLNACPSLLPIFTVEIVPVRNKG